MYKFYIAILFIMAVISIAGFVLHFTYGKSYSRERYIKPPTINNLVDAVYVISMPDRMSYITNVLGMYKIKAEFIEPLIATELDKSQLIEEGSITAGCVLNMGRIACHMSHIKTLQTFLSSTHHNCLIFEDDLKEPSKSIDYFSEIKNIIDNVPADYDIIYLGRCWDKCNKDIKVTNNIVQTFFPQCRHAYIVSRSGAKKIISESLPLSEFPGDFTIAKAIENGKITAFATTPPLFRQNRSQLGTVLGNTDDLRECQ